MAKMLSTLGGSSLLSLLNEPKVRFFLFCACSTCLDLSPVDESKLPMCLHKKGCSLPRITLHLGNHLTPLMTLSQARMPTQFTSTDSCIKSIKRYVKKISFPRWLGMEDDPPKTVKFSLYKRAVNLI